MILKANKASLLQQIHGRQLGNLWDGTGPVLHPAGEHVAVLDVVRLRHGQQGVGGQGGTRDQLRLGGLLLTHNITGQTDRLILPPGEDC